MMPITMRILLSKRPSTRLISSYRYPFARLIFLIGPLTACCHMTSSTTKSVIKKRAMISIRTIVLVTRVRKDQIAIAQVIVCLLYTSDAADDLLCVDLGGRRI